MSHKIKINFQWLNTVSQSVSHQRQCTYVRVRVEHTHTLEFSILKFFFFEFCLINLEIQQQH